MPRLGAHRQVAVEDIRSRLCFLAGGFTLDELSEGAFCVSLGAVLAVSAPYLHVGKDPVDSPTASRALTDFELAGQTVEIFGAHDDIF
jgi:hypothetical protein